MAIQQPYHIADVRLFAHAVQTARQRQGVADCPVCQRLLVPLDS